MNEHIIKILDEDKKSMILCKIYCLLVVELKVHFQMEVAASLA